MSFIDIAFEPYRDISN